MNRLSPSLQKLVEGREQWRALHQKGEHEAIRQLLQDANVETLRKTDLSAVLPVDLDQKLSAFSREWDRAIAAVAVHEGAEFHRVDLQLSPSSIAQFQLTVEEKLRQPAPWGALLFLESHLPLELTRDQWRAYAYFVLASSHDMQELELGKCPGVVNLLSMEKVKR